MRYRKQATYCSSRVRMRNSFWAALLGLLFTLPLALSASAQQGGLKSEVITVAVRPDAAMRYLAITGNAEAKAAIVLLAGGNGALQLDPGGTIGTDLAGNFLVRSRGLF